MRFWLRELGGWLLVAAGLYVFYECYVMLLGRQVIEAGTWSVVGIIVFRGGIHLLKVAVAARVCLLAREKPPDHPKAPESRQRAGARPIMARRA